MFSIMLSGVPHGINPRWWVVTGVVTALGVNVFASSWISGLMLICLAILISPPVYDRLLVAIKVGDPLHLRMLVVLIGLTASTYVLNVHTSHMEDQRVAAAKAEQDRTDQLEREASAAAANAKIESTRQFYLTNKSSILREIATALDSRDVNKATAINAKYASVITDPEYLVLQQKLARLAAEMAQAKREQERKDKIAGLLADLKTVDAADYTKAMSLYTSLLELDPSNKTYQQSLERFKKAEASRQSKIEADQQAAAARASRTKQIESQFSPWDGSHRTFERLIKQAMNDPDSYDHVDTRYVDKGKFIRVYATFRGKNAFGGTVKNTRIADFDIDGNFLREVE
ncbi:hypothetical protein [Pseudomonas cannabina]|uniref:Uncharacterized protein n=1 Tax=Pseudomonas cannabina TaxID=86840 RepID=A0A0P9L3Y3_PSECA|nr:hypothetical protein [Pseudomonas cannabina]KAA8698572.1 hypothetical protein F4W70_27695 [Pseudomonas cannabina]KPW68869.1 hypothetical protein ALO81_200145 [Pseudomonas cannabina]SDR56105.1 hypothetical protein SAMN05216597_5965 [Pseudomonas cannabina]